MGGAASSLPAIRRRTGNEDVAPPGFCNCLVRIFKDGVHVGWSGRMNAHVQEPIASDV